VSRRLIGLAAVAAAGFLAAALLLLPHSPAGLKALVLGLGPFAPAIALAAWLVLTPASRPSRCAASRSR
jgi:hypothetical protein